LAAVDEGLQDVLLDGEIAVDDGRHRRTELRQVLDALGDGEVSDVVGCRFGAQQEMIADVLFDGALKVIAADDGIGQIELFDQRLELAAVPPGDLPPKDGHEFRGLPDRTVGIEEALAERIGGGAPLEDQVVAVFDLGEKQPMLTGGLTSFRRREESRERPEPLLRTVGQIARHEGVGERLQTRRVVAGQEGVAALPKRNPLRGQAMEANDVD
jgi:hypothetical protein